MNSDSSDKPARRRASMRPHDSKRRARKGALAEVSASKLQGFADPDDFLATVQGRFESLSPQLKTIARHVDAVRERIALESVQQVAAACGVQPSAVVRFAQHFGFSGFSQMQSLFRDQAQARLDPARGYQQRLRALLTGSAQAPSAGDLGAAVIDGAIASLGELRNGLAQAQLEEAVGLLQRGKTIWIAGARRSFPVAAYLAYALQQTDRPVHWLGGMGHMQTGELRAIRRDDVLIAISFEPYASETLAAVELASHREVAVLAITDSRLGPIARRANVTLTVEESAVHGFRSLAATFCLAHTLFLALAGRLELESTRA